MAFLSIVNSSLPSTFIKSILLYNNRYDTKKNPRTVIFQLNRFVLSLVAIIIAPSNAILLWFAIKITDPSLGTRFLLIIFGVIWGRENYEVNLILFSGFEQKLEVKEECSDYSICYFTDY